MNEKTLRYTLTSDGSSDAALLPLLTWLLETYLPDYAIQPTWADLRGLYNPPNDLLGKIIWSIELYPCDLLLVHRDAEKQSHELRISQIKGELNKAIEQGYTIPTVCVVPIRMQEAWLLIEPQAIRDAVGNSNGQQPINLPHISRLEDLPDPKEILYQFLKDASGLSPHRLNRFHVGEKARRVAEFIQDFSKLRRLTAFQTLELDLQQIIEEQGWSIVT